MKIIMLLIFLNSYSTVFNFLFLQIERIQNRMLYQQYEFKLNLLKKQNPTGCINERKLWHGTSYEAVASINNYGFHRSYCGKNGIHNYPINLLSIRSSNLWIIYLQALRASWRFRSSLSVLQSLSWLFHIEIDTHLNCKNNYECFNNAS